MRRDAIFPKASFNLLSSFAGFTARTASISPGASSLSRPFSLASSHHSCSGCGSSILACHRSTDTGSNSSGLRGVAVVTLHSAVLHLSCAGPPPRGVIPADLLWQLRRSAGQNGNRNLYLPTEKKKKIPAPPKKKFHSIRFPSCGLECRGLSAE